MYELACMYGVQRVNKLASYVNKENIMIFNSTEPALDRQAIASGHEANKNQESLKLLSSTNGPLSGVFCTMVSEATTNPEQDDQSLVGVRHTNGPRATDAAASAGTLQINQYNK